MTTYPGRHRPLCDRGPLAAQGAVVREPGARRHRHLLPRPRVPMTSASHRSPAPRRRPPGSPPTLDDPRVRVADVRWYLAGKRGADEYARGHIPGASFVDLDRELAAPPARGPGRHPLPSAADFAGVLARLGVERETVVVAYDDAGGAIAARLWWLLRWFGHGGGRVLDGGLGAWTAAGHPLSTDSPAIVPAPPLDLSPGAARVVDKAEVDRLRTRPSAVLLDARAAERFEGRSRARRRARRPRPRRALGALRRQPRRAPAAPFLPAAELAERYARSARSRPRPSSATAARASPPATTSWRSRSRAATTCSSTRAPGATGREILGYRPRSALERRGARRLLPLADGQRRGARAQYRATGTASRSAGSHREAPRGEGRRERRASLRASAPRGPVARTCPSPLGARGPTDAACRALCDALWPAWCTCRPSRRARGRTLRARKSARRAGRSSRRARRPPLRAGRSSRRARGPSLRAGRLSRRAGRSPRRARRPPLRAGRSSRRARGPSLRAGRSPRRAGRSPRRARRPPRRAGRSPRRAGRSPRRARRPPRRAGRSSRRARRPTLRAGGSSRRAGGSSRRAGGSSRRAGRSSRRARRPPRTTFRRDELSAPPQAPARYRPAPLRLGRNPSLSALVGHEGLEPSANGLRVHCSTN